MPDAKSNVVVYTTEPCGFCTQAKKLLQSRGVEYEEINLARSPEGREALVAKTGQMTFPQILIGDRSIGGFRELVMADRDGSLKALLATAA
jgi:glutaredoxin 3